MAKFKSRISLVLAILMLATLVACAPAPAAESPTPGASATPAAEATPTPSATPAAAGEDVTLKFWYWDGSAEEAYTKIIADFESKNPGIKIEASILPWNDYWTKLQTALPTGEGPDLMWMNHPNAVSYMPSGNLMDMTPANYDFTHFADNLVAPFSKDGKRYGVPIFFDTVVMFYNKKLLAEAGVPEPQRGWTWDEMREAAKKLTKTDGDEVTQYGLAVAPGVQAGSFEFVMQNGGHVFTDDHMKSDLANSPEAKAAIQFVLDMKFKDKSLLTGAEFLQQNQMGELFINNLIAMEISGMWRVKPYHDALGADLGIAHMAKGKVEASTFHNVAYVASAKTKHPDAVQKFLEYTTTKEHADFLAPVFLPAYDQSQDAWFATFPDLNMKVFSESIEYAFPLQISAKNAGPVYAAFEKQLETLYTEPDLGDKLTAVDAAINAEIAK